MSQLSMTKLILALMVLIHGIAAVSSRKSVHEDNGVLIIYDSKITDLDDYSNLMKGLESHGYQADIVDTTSDSAEGLSLFAKDVRLYQNIVLFPLKMKNIPGVSSVDFLEHMKEGGNIVSMTSPEALQDDVKVFLNELGIFPSGNGYQVVDHFEFDQKLGKSSHNVLSLNSSFIKNDKIISSNVAEVIYSGSAAQLSSSPLLVPIIQAPVTSYTSKEGDVYVSGSQSYLAVAMQARNNARATWVGSSEFFSDEYTTKHDLIIADLIDWTFGAKNVIKSTFVNHYHSDDKDSEELYKIKDQVTYEIGLTEWDGSQWIPYQADDVQVEARMLDPYYRLNLTPSHQEGTAQVYTTTFNLPDQYGMFTFYTNYKRDGISFIEEKNVVTVRHLANDEYPRSWEIPNSWVYIASNAAVAVSFLVFTFMFIYKK